MKDSVKTKKQLVKELAEIRDRCERLEGLKFKHEKLEEKLANANAILSTAIEQTPVGFGIINVPQLTTHIISLEVLGITGKEERPKSNTPFEKALEGIQLIKQSGVPYEFEEIPVIESIQHGTISKNVEIIVHLENGEERWVLANAAPVHNSKGEIIAGVAVFSDISQLKAMEAERARTLSLFAHDMKSPLIATIGFLNRLLSGKAGKMTRMQEEHLQIIQAEVKRVQSICLDFLDVARLGKDRIKLVMVSTDLIEILESLRQEYGTRTQEAGLSFEIEIQERLPLIYTDPQRLVRAITNLLDNAIKYSKEGQVKLWAGVSDSGEVLMEVTDQGPGLSKDDLAQLFHAFYRGSAGKGIEGTGLGLAAVKAIVEAHGGTVAGRNRPEGGANFIVTLPAKGNIDS